MLHEVLWDMFLGQNFEGMRFAFVYTDVENVLPTESTLLPLLRWLLFRSDDVLSLKLCWPLSVHSCHTESVHPQRICDSKLSL